MIAGNILERGGGDSFTFLAREVSEARTLGGSPGADLGSVSFWSLSFVSLLLLLLLLYCCLLLLLFSSSLSSKLRLILLLFVIVAIVITVLMPYLVLIVKD